MRPPFVSAIFNREACERINFVICSFINQIRHTTVEPLLSLKGACRTTICGFAKWFEEYVTLETLQWLLDHPIFPLTMPWTAALTARQSPDYGCCYRLWRKNAAVHESAFADMRELPINVRFRWYSGHTPPKADIQFTLTNIRLVSPLGQISLVAVAPWCAAISTSAFMRQ